MTRSIPARRFTTVLSRWGLGAATLLVATGALAQTAGDQAAADALYDEGRALLKAGDRAAGCAKFEASLALSPAASTMINIARCHEQDGKLATAYVDYKRALQLNRDTVGATRRAELAELAEQGLRTLEPRLPRLRIVLKSPPPGAQVRRDDEEIPPAALGTALPTDPGPHAVRASAPGYRAETRTVVVEEGKTAVVELDLHASAADAKPAADWSRPVGIALAAAGAAGVGVGAVAGILSLHKVSALKARCPDYPHCPADDTVDRDTLRSAKALGSVATAGFIAGGVLAAAGAVVLVLRPGREAAVADGGARTSAAGTLRILFGPGRCVVQGRF